MIHQESNTFCFIVRGESGEPICGAKFAMDRLACHRCRDNQGCQDEQLYPNDQGCQDSEARYVTTSDECGEVVFGDLPVGDYVLTEVSVPRWVEPNDEKSFSVRINECNVIVDGSCEPFALFYETKFISDFGEAPELAIGVYNGFNWLEFIRATVGALLIMIPYAGGTASALFNYLTTMGRTDPTKELILQEISKIVKKNLDDQDVRQIRGVLSGINEYMMADFIPSKASGLRPKAELYRDLKVRYDQMYQFIGWLKEINNDTFGAYFNVFQLAAIQFISIAQELALLDPNVSSPLSSDFCNVIKKEAAVFKKHGEESIVKINNKRDTYFQFKTHQQTKTMCYKYWIDDYAKFESHTFQRDNWASFWALCPITCVRTSYYPPSRPIYSCHSFDTLAKTNAAAEADMYKWQGIRHQEIYNELGMEPFYSALDRLVITPLDYRP